MLKIADFPDSKFICERDDKSKLHTANVGREVVTSLIVINRERERVTE